MRELRVLRGLQCDMDPRGQGESDTSEMRFAEAIDVMRQIADELGPGERSECGSKDDIQACNA